MNLETQRNTLRIVKIALVTIQVVIIAVLIKFDLRDFVSTADTRERIYVV